MTAPTRARRTRYRGLLHLLLQPIYWSAYLFHRLFGNRSERRNRVWEERLQYKLFFQGLPTYVAVFGMAVAAIFAWRDTYTHDAVYANAAQAAFQAADFERAALYYGRLASERPDVVPYQYNLGISLAGKGDEARAAAVLAPLAPEDRLGYAPAHLWIADRLLRTQPRPTDDQLRTAESHLLRIKRDATGLSDQIHEGLTQIYALQSRIDEILDDPLLLEAAKRRPDLRLMLARVAVSRKRFAEAEQTARELVPVFRRSVDADPYDETARGRLCEAYALLGDEASLNLTLRKGAALNPHGRFGEQLADLAVVRALRLGNSSTATKTEKAIARSDAVKLLDQYGRQTERSQLLAGQLARQAGEFDEAERRYLSAVKKLPETHIELADLYLQTGRPDDARRQWEAYLMHSRAKRNSAEPPSEGARLLAAVASQKLGEFEDAERWLQEDVASSAMKGALLQLYAAWWDSQTNEGRVSPPLDLLRKGLRLDPANAPLLARLLAAARKDQTGGDEARATLRQMIAAGELPATAYLLLGTDAFERGDRSAAEKYLEQARRLDPQSPTILNNLAWTLYSAEPPDLSAALVAADAAVSAAPAELRFRDTRFRILAQMQKWPEALEDLEKCAAVMKSDPDFHRAAADVYEHLDLPDLAAEHRRLAGDLPKDASPNN